MEPKTLDLSHYGIIPSFCMFFNTKEELQVIADRIPIISNKVYDDTRKPWRSITIGSLGMFIVDNHCANDDDEHKLYLEVYKNHNSHSHPYPELLKNKIPYKAGVKITFQSKVNRNYNVGSDFKLIPNDPEAGWCEGLYLWTFIYPNVDVDSTFIFDPECVKFHTAPKLGFRWKSGEKVVVKYDVGDIEFPMLEKDQQYMGLKLP